MDSSLAREQDAAFFEDWSEWTSLDDLPPRPRGAFNAPIVNGPRSWGRWHHCWCVLRKEPGWIGGPHFEIVVPIDYLPTERLCRRIPGARQHPGLWGRNAQAMRKLQGTWYVPAEHWQAVRAALPAIKQAIKARYPAETAGAWEPGR